MTDSLLGGFEERILVQDRVFEWRTRGKLGKTRLRNEVFRILKDELNTRFTKQKNRAWYEVTDACALESIRSNFNENS